jgi:uncharacterized SAM-binding protein YcdF (DUF218 family)
VLYRLLLVAEPPRHADAIVVLGGGVLDDNLPSSSTTARLVHGLRLQHAGFASRVILTGGNPDNPAIPEATVMRRVAEEIGTKPEVLIVEPRAERTATQGDAVARIARAHAIRSVLLVTSPEHSYRAARVFRKTGLEVISTPVVPRHLPSITITLDPRALSDRFTALVPLVYEGVALGLYWWRGWL